MFKYEIIDSEIKNKKLCMYEGFLIYQKDINNFELPIGMSWAMDDFIEIYGEMTFEIAEKFLISHGGIKVGKNLQSIVN